jgi:hypothetical protein
MMIVLGHHGVMRVKSKSGGKVAIEGLDIAAQELSDTGSTNGATIILAEDD